MKTNSANSTSGETSENQKSDDLIELGKLQPGVRGTVAEMTGNPNDIARLSEMGLRKGASIELVRGGRTLMVKVCCQTMCLRLTEETRILVNPLTLPESARSA